jgi:hypothetical protein
LYDTSRENGRKKKTARKKDRNMRKDKDRITSGQKIR